MRDVRLLGSENVENAQETAAIAESSNNVLKMRFCLAGDVVTRRMLLSLPQCELADLSFNNLHSLSFPPLNTLFHLSLSGNFLSLPSFLTLPSSLLSLDLSANPVLPGDLAKIRRICTSLQCFGGNLTEISYKECRGLLGVSLRSTNKDVAHLFSISEDPSSPPSPKLLKYKKLDLGMNSSLNFDSLSSGLKEQGHLEDLSVDNCRMSAKSLQILLDSLYPSSTDSHTVKFLNISFNPLPPTSFSTLFSILTASPCLLELDTSGIPMNLQAAKTVAYFLAHNNSIKVIKLRNCSLDVSSQRHIVAGLSSNTQSALISLQGIMISVVALSLGFPKDMEGRSNNVILDFLRSAWKSWQKFDNVGSGKKWEMHKKFLAINHPHLRAPASPKFVLECVATTWATYKHTLSVIEVRLGETSSTRASPLSILFFAPLYPCSLRLQKHIIPTSASPSLSSSSSSGSAQIVSSSSSSSSVSSLDHLSSSSPPLSTVNSTSTPSSLDASDPSSPSLLKQADFSWLRFYKVPYCQEEHERLKTLYNSPISSNGGKNKRKRSGLGRTISMASFRVYRKNRISHYPRIESLLNTLSLNEHFLTLNRLHIIESKTETGQIYGETASSINYGLTSCEVEEFVIGPRKI